MRDKMSMARYIEAARAHHDLNPQDEEALHRQHVESLGLSGAAKEHIIKERMAAVAAHLASNESVRRGISRLDDKSQIKELDKIHEREQRGKSPEPDDNEETDAYLSERAKQTASRR
jgi:hypothetical protein